MLLGLVLQGRRMVVLVVMVLRRRRLLVLGWKRFKLLLVVLRRMGIVRGLLFLVLVGLDFDGRAVCDGRDDGRSADGHFRGGGMVRKMRRWRDVFHRGTVVGEFVRRRLLLLLGWSAAVIVRRRDHLHLGRMGPVWNVADVRRRVVQWRRMVQVWWRLVVHLRRRRSHAAAGAWWSSEVRCSIGRNSVVARRRC